MSSMAVYLRSRPKLLLRGSAPVYSSSSRAHFSSSSSSSSSDSSDETPRNMENAQTNSTSFFSDVRSHLKGSDWKPSEQPPRPGFSFSSQGARPPRSKPSSVDIAEIRKNLSGFTRRSVDPSRPSGVQDSQGQPSLSFQNIYKKMSENSAPSGGFAGKDTKLAIDSIRKHLQNPATTGLNRQRPSSFSLTKFKESLNIKPTDGSNAADNLPHSVFGKELREKSMKVEDANKLLKEYSKDELGEKLRKLRPEGVKQGQNWFSLSELKERLIKLRELEEQQQHSESHFDELRRTIREVKWLNAEKENKIHNQGVGIVGHLGGTPTYMLAPPKENLVEKYYHPDNMSSAEKLKLKLKAVRDEFKMSDTDCGSTRVQIAQLTTEILHLSKVLHKKDKHSLKGLLAKVQLRKKLLKYLRRTDWDSYCFILSKLGLRDNPGYKQH